MFERRVFQEWSWRSIAEEVGLSVRECQRIVKRLEEQRTTGLLERDPTQVFEWLLREHQHSLLLCELMIAEADQDAVRIAAINAREKSLVRIRELLQATGHLSSDVPRLALHAEDFRNLAGTLLSVLKERGLMDVAREVDDRIQRSPVAKHLPPGK